MSSDLVELVEQEHFVEFGKKFERLNRWEKKSVVEEVDKKFKPVEEAEKFFELGPSDVNKLALVVAANAVASGLKTSQIRKILNMSGNIYRKARNKKDVSADIAKLRYVLAYVAARHREILPVAEVLDRIIPKLDGENYEKFHDFLQAIVAYHKLLGGRD